HIPAVGDGVEVAGWRLDVVDASGRRAARVLLHAPAPEDGDVPEEHGRKHDRQSRREKKHENKSETRVEKKEGKR
ncbi:hypothetical protein P8605_47140, partial [Streptomyces sp. T-3]|nr:hypothetical protein [Streptomyces sp. T-3]